MPVRAGPGFERLFIMHRRIFHVNTQSKPMPARAGSGFGGAYIVYGRICHAHGLGKPMPSAAGPGFGNRRLSIDPGNRSSVRNSGLRTTESLRTPEFTE